MENTRLMQIACAAIYELELTEYEHERILEVLDITEQDYQTITEWGKENY